MKPEPVRAEAESTPDPETGRHRDSEQRADRWAGERWTVDGLESTPAGVVARLERPDGTTLVRPLADLPAGVREGDLLAVTDGPDGVILVPLPAETAARRAAAQATLDALNAGSTARLPRDEDGDIIL